MAEEFWYFAKSRPLDDMVGPFDSAVRALTHAMESPLQLEGDVQLVRIHDGASDVIASTDPRDLDD